MCVQKESKNWQTTATYPSCNTSPVIRAYMLLFCCCWNNQCCQHTWLEPKPDELCRVGETTYLPSNRAHSNKTSSTHRHHRRWRRRRRRGFIFRSDWKCCAIFRTSRIALFFHTTLESCFQVAVELIHSVAFHHVDGLSSPLTRDARIFGFLRVWQAHSGWLPCVIGC